VRPEWADLPAAIRAEVEDRLGSPVVSAVNQRGGFGPSLAARCGLPSVAGLTGYFLHHANLPAPPGLPTLRAFRAAQGVHALDWLRVRTLWS